MVLAPTHELARQLSGFAKALLHDPKLRVLCASRANDKSAKKHTDAHSAQMALGQFAMEYTGAEDGVLEGKRGVHLVGVGSCDADQVAGDGWRTRVG